MATPNEEPLNGIVAEELASAIVKVSSRGRHLKGVQVGMRAASIPLILPPVPCPRRDVLFLPRHLPLIHPWVPAMSSGAFPLRLNARRLRAYGVTV